MALTHNRRDIGARIEKTVARVIPVNDEETCVSGNAAVVELDITDFRSSTDILACIKSFPTVERVILRHSDVASHTSTSPTQAFNFPIVEHCDTQCAVRDFEIRAYGGGDSTERRSADNQAGLLIILVMNFTHLESLSLTGVLCDARGQTIRGRIVASRLQTLTIIGPSTIVERTAQFLTTLISQFPQLSRISIVCTDTCPLPLKAWVCERIASAGKLEKLSLSFGLNRSCKWTLWIPLTRFRYADPDLHQ